MPSIDWWQNAGIVSAAILAVLTLALRVGTLLRAVWRTINRLNAVADDLLGDPDKGIPSMKERLDAVEKASREHLDWHGDPGGSPARRGGPGPNGGPPHRGRAVR